MRSRREAGSFASIVAGVCTTFNNVRASWLLHGVHAFFMNNGLPWTLQGVSSTKSALVAPRSRPITMVKEARNDDRLWPFCNTGIRGDG